MVLRGRCRRLRAGAPTTNTSTHLSPGVATSGVYTGLWHGVGPAGKRCIHKNKSSEPHAQQCCDANFFCKICREAVEAGCWRRRVDGSYSFSRQEGVCEGLRGGGNISLRHAGGLGGGSIYIFRHSEVCLPRRGGGQLSKKFFCLSCRPENVFQPA